MAENKTRPTDVRVGAFLDAVNDDARRDDCRRLVKLMTKITGHRPIMWGPSIVGFGNYHYQYESGREGDACLTGFSPRKGDISIYLVAAGPGQDGLLAKLGKHRMGKACLYIRALADVDLLVLEKLIAGSVAEVRRRYG